MFPFQLKTKIKSLAAEARDIREDEKRAIHKGSSPTIRRRRATLMNGPEEWRAAAFGRYHSLHDHRTGPVRDAARSALLAYGFLRGRTYDQIEGTSKTNPSWSDVDKMVLRYGTREQWQAFPDWLPERDAIWAMHLKKQRENAA